MELQLLVTCCATGPLPRGATKKLGDVYLGESGGRIVVHCEADAPGAVQFMLSGDSGAHWLAKPIGGFAVAAGAPCAFSVEAKKFDTVSVCYANGEQPLNNFRLRTYLEPSCMLDRVPKRGYIAPPPPSEFRNLE
ncbi:MAG: hypothetical protein P1U53_18440 [Sulfitobacter sp.]|nr:hypothetical protein [Sulfitobacter sp.]